MKRAYVFLFLSLLLSGQVLMAQVRKLPAAVTEAFKAKYPSASNVEWKDKLTGFTATFNNNNNTYEARFTNKGEWQSTEQSVGEEALPQAVKDGLSKSKFADWSVEDVYRIELPGDKIEYRVGVKKSDLQKKNLLFSNEGRLLKDRVTL